MYILPYDDPVRTEHVRFCYFNICNSKNTLYISFVVRKYYLSMHGMSNIEKLKETY
jgi:hypothetical protein